MGKRALGDCYRWAYRYVLKHPGALLHQGTVVAPFVGAGTGRYGHAWVVDGGVVKDWQTMVAGLGGHYKGVGWPEAVWVKSWQPRGVRVFSIEQAAIEMAKHGHYGPW